MAENVRGQKNTMDEFEDKVSNNRSDIHSNETISINEKKRDAIIELPRESNKIKRQEGIEGRVD